MKLKLLILISWLMTLTSVNAAGEEETGWFVHPDLHLFFTFNKITKEAAVTDDGPESKDGNSLVIPYDDNYKPDNTNYWKNLVIPSTVEYLGETYTVTEIGSRAFQMTTLIETITLPETIRKIGDGAFKWCLNLKSVNIPHLVESIPSNCFNYCRELESIHLPDSIKYIDYGAFYDCKKLSEINIPGACLEIGADAFSCCSSLTKITIEDSDSTLHLSYSYELSIEYEGNETPSVRGQFADCPKYDLYLGRNLSFPQGDSYVSYSPFGAGSKNFISLTMSDYVTEIPDELFEHAVFNSYIKLPNNLKKIGKESFSAEFRQQIELTIPETVENIGNRAFVNSGLRFIKCNCLTPPSIDNGTPHETWETLTFESRLYVDNGLRRLFATIYVPNGTGKAYRNTINWDDYIIIDPADEVTTINVRTPGTLYSRLLAQDLQANEVCRLQLKGTLNSDDWTILKQMKHCYDIDLSNLNIQEIPNKFFYENSSIVNIKLPNILETIGDSLFYSCDHLTNIINIPNTCAEIGIRSFYNTAIEGINYTSSIHIKEFAFRNCVNLQEFDLEGNGTTVDSCAMNGTSIKRLTIGKGTAVNDMAFFFNEQLNEVIFKDGVILLGKDAFNGCDKIKVVRFEGDIEEIKSCPWSENIEEVHISDIEVWLNLPFPDLQTNPLCQAEHFFLNGEEITHVTIPGNITNIKDNVFYGCKSLRSLTLHEGVVSIGDFAFYGCSNLGDFILPANVKSIGAFAFTGCESLTSIDIPISVSLIDQESFAGCSNLTKIVAHWNNPLTIDSNTFSDVSPKCYLFIPIGTSTKYYNAGWNAIPNIKEAGIMNIVVTNGGSVKYVEEIVKEEPKTFFFAPYKSFTLTFEPDNECSLRKVYLNGSDVTSEVEGLEYFIEEPEENMNIKAIFAKDNIVLGDANGDGNVNVADATCVVNHFLKKSPAEFYEFAADVNDDGVINITDAIIIIKRIMNK